MQPRLPSFPLLELDGRGFTAHHVLAAADLRGELAPALDQLAARLAVVQEVDTPSLQRALDGFRTARALTAVDDFKSWLSARDLGLGDVADFLERQLARPGEARREDGAAVYGELVCRGLLDRWMLALGRRLAVHAQWLEGGRSEPAPDALPRMPTATAFVGEGLEASELQRLAEAEAVYATLEARLLVDTRLQRVLEARKLELVAFDLEVFGTPSADVARELRLCLKVDGLGIEELTRRSGLPLREVHAFAEALPRVVQRELLAAVPGEVLGPFVVEGEHQVLRLRRKALPSLARPEVRARLEAEARSGAFGDALHERVRWPRWRPAGGAA